MITVPGFAAKGAENVGLYLTQRENAFVFCVDEKQNIQAPERRTGYAVSSNKKPVKALKCLQAQRDCKFVRRVECSN